MSVMVDLQKPLSNSLPLQASPARRHYRRTILLSLSRSPNPSILGIVIAVFELGALVGAPSCLDLGDRLGRRSTVFLGTAFMVAGGMPQTNAWHVA
jgi:MFS family permease